ncbi:MAG TPA: NADH-quinone oxidoreductase subunit L [Thermoanaerobaculia bacterium]|nr:NADH-quinone oxidoreductase subunit L [Thermoanaerobaculia bacterium]
MLNQLGLIPLIPFIGFLLNGLFGRRAGKSFVTFVALATTFTTAILATVASFQYVSTYEHGERHLNVVYEWFLSGGIGTDIAFQLDPLSIVMVLVVTWIGFLIHLYSVGYMAHEEGYSRYFAYLNLFLAAMLILVLGSSYLFIFVGWEGVGLCSYLLIGFYYEKNFAAAAGKKAFIVNRIGDFGFLIAMFLMFTWIGSVDFERVATAVAGGGIAQGVLIAICLLLFLGACGKSAQIPLYVWLPDAMAGPTPVSALIHAATMVTAGVYMVVRSNVLFRAAPEALMVVAVIGALTALLAATIAVAQNDIKKVLAYSTVSQLGFMFMAAGVGAFVAAIFHLVTHAFFKACLFLGSGSVIHAMGGEQDIRAMGGLKPKIPITFWTFAVATFAIAGFPFAAGFFSKDEILASALVTPYFPVLGKFVYAAGTIAAFLTAFYMYRMFYLVFYGKFRGTHEQEHHLHESPSSMTIPLIVLAALSAVGGLLGIPHLIGHAVHFPHILETWLHGVLPEVAGLPPGVFAIPAGPEIAVMVISTLVALGGWALAKSLYRDKALASDERLEARNPALVRTLENKYWVDEAYDRAIVTPLNRFSTFLWKVIDAIIDGTLSLLGYVAAAMGDLMRFIQTGNVRNYALMLFLGVIVFIWVYV